MNDQSIPNWEHLENEAAALIKDNLSGRVLEAVRIERTQSRSIRIQCGVALSLALLLNAFFFIHPIEQTNHTEDAQLTTASGTVLLSAERKELLKSL